MPKKNPDRRESAPKQHPPARRPVDANRTPSYFPTLGRFPEEVPVGLATLDRHLRILYVNPELARISGQSATAHRGRPVIQILRFMTPPLQPLLQRVIRTGRQVLQQKVSGRRHRRFKGADDWLVSCIPQVEAGKAQYVHLVLQAIGQHQRAQARWRENEEEFRSLADSTPMMIWQSDTSGGCTYFNNSWLAFTGRPIEEQVGKGWLKSVHPEDRKRCMGIYLHAFKARQPFTMEYRLRRFDQEYRWILDKGAPWHDRNSRFMGFLGSCTDVTESRHAVEKFRQVVEANPSAIILAGADGKILMVNTRTEELFGYSRSELVGQPVEILIPERYRAAHPGFRRDFFLNPSRRNMGAGRDLFGVRKDGREIPVEVGLSPIDTESGVQVLATINDITERKRAELETQENREELVHMRRVSTVGELAASIAHELNQPLTAILSNTQAAIRFMNSDIPDLNEVRNILKDVVADDKRAGEVIRRLRGLFKRKTLELKPLAINEIVKDVSELLHSDAIIRKASIFLELTPDLAFTYGDEVQLQQVLLNLVLNGLDAMTDTPVNQRIITIGTYRDSSERQQISVKDRGHGIGKMNLERIFNPFFTTKKEGLGMGLAVARSIIEGHKGQLWAENNLDGGAVFHFTLPVYRVDPEGSPST